VRTGGGGYPSQTCGSHFKKILFRSNILLTLYELGGFRHCPKKGEAETGNEGSFKPPSAVQSPIDNALGPKDRGREIPLDTKPRCKKTCFRRPRLVLSYSAKRLSGRCTHEEGQRITEGWAGSSTNKYATILMPGQLRVGDPRKKCSEYIRTTSNTQGRQNMRRTGGGNNQGAQEG